MNSNKFTKGNHYKSKTFICFVNYNNTIIEQGEIFRVEKRYYTSDEETNGSSIIQVKLKNGKSKYLKLNPGETYKLESESFLMDNNSLSLNTKKLFENNIKLFI